jgi:hypothetical protein
VGTVLKKGATTSMNSNVEANDASSSIPIDATMTSTSTTGGASRQLVGRQASYKLATGMKSIALFVQYRVKKELAPTLR